MKASEYFRNNELTLKETIRTDGEDVEIYRAAITVKNEKSELFKRATNFECSLVLFSSVFFCQTN